MRSILAATLLLSPMLYSASAVASQPKPDTTDAPQGRRISTGVIEPAVVGSGDIHIPPSTLLRNDGNGAEVVLALTVDAKGNAENIRVVKSADPDLDARVVTGVSQAHFRPAKLDNQAIPVDLNMIVQVNR
jgi:TonB family protein